MATVNTKDVPNKRNSLGQYFTPEAVAQFCLAHTDFKTSLIIEPSCGRGVFLDKIDGVGLEADPELVKLYTGTKQIRNINFYDFNEKLTDVTFIGNPPYRTPAISVTDDPTYGRRNIVKSLMKKYGITGMREEAVFFIVKSVDLILENKVRGYIYYILPKSIFHNNSKAFQSFAKFLKQHVKLVSVTDLPQDFANVNTDLCYVHMEIGTGEEFLYNGTLTKVDSFYGINEDIITFHDIFTKTYLGSVPCESVLLSVRGEPADIFRQRLINLLKARITADNLIEHLSHNGNVHLRSLKNPDKIKVVTGYVHEIQEMMDVKDFEDVNNYKTIQHRHEIRHYFRHDRLKKASFVYQLNPNPCPSFYFPGNPSKGCLDYYGYCDYDVNRNCSPSANRTVPLAGDYLTDSFKEYWANNTDLPLEKVFDYLIKVLESTWYQDMKNRYQRWYFGVPRQFLR